LRGKLRNRFLTLLAQKEIAEQRRIKINEIVDETGIAFTTIQRWMRNEITKAEGPVLEAFCEYFDCDVGDLLYIDKSVNE
jgi:DNA-binding Xre family transcriptional regulator